MTAPKVLLVDDDQDELFLTQRSLERESFQVVSVTNVVEAFKQILAQSFDVLITDLHMPEPGDGFAVVTAMHHAQPGALNLIISDFPDVQRAMSAACSEADEILVKPCAPERVVELLQTKMRDPKPNAKRVKESVASILERDAAITIERWSTRIGLVEELVSVRLTPEERTAHLPDILKNISTRLRIIRVVEAIAIPSPAAVEHGKLRYRQGYTASLMVQESRILQVCIFETIQRNLPTVDFGLVLPDIMLIADEVDSQLAQSIESFLSLQLSGATRAAARN